MAPPKSAAAVSPQPAFGSPLRKLRSYNSRTPMAAAARSPIIATTPNRRKGGKPSTFLIDPKTLATRLLVDPMAGAMGRGARNVLEDTNSTLVRCFVMLKSASERWFTHLFLLLALIIYAVIGGAIFNRIEGDFEDEQNVSGIVFFQIKANLILIYPFSGHHPRTPLARLKYDRINGGGTVAPATPVSAAPGRQRSVFCGHPHAACRRPALSS